MNVHRTARFLVVSVAASLVLSGRARAQCRITDWLWADLDRFHLRESFDKTRAVAPAYALASFPVGEPTAVIVGAAARFDVPCYKIAPTVEYARNTQLTKKQDVLKAGVIRDWSINRGAGGLEPTAKVAFKRDGTSHASGVEAKVLATFFGPFVDWSIAGLILPSNQVKFAASELTFVPYFGLEGERASHTDTTSGVGRSLISLNLDVYPFTPVFGTRLELLAVAEYRDDIWRSPAAGDRHHPWFTASATYYILRDAKKRAVGIGATYMKGENPSNGLARQEATQLALKAQF